MTASAPSLRPAEHGQPAADAARARRAPARASGAPAPSATATRTAAAPGAASTSRTTAIGASAYHDERLLAAREQPDGREHHRAEDHQREDVQQGLGDHRAQHGGELVARAPQPARHDQGARGLAEPRGQRGRHQHPDRRALHGVDEPRPGLGQRRAQDRLPGDRAQPPSRRTSGRARRAPTSGSRTAAWSAIDCRPMRWSARKAPRAGGRPGGHEGDAPHRPQPAARPRRRRARAWPGGARARAARHPARAVRGAPGAEIAAAFGAGTSRASA